jgi:hypothetical protein
MSLRSNLRRRVRVLAGEGLAGWVGFPPPDISIPVREGRGRELRRRDKAKSHPRIIFSDAEY